VVQEERARIAAQLESDSAAVGERLAAVEVERAELQEKLSTLLMVEDRLAAAEKERSDMGEQLAAVKAEREALEEKLVAGLEAEKRLEAAEAGQLEAAERLAAAEVARAALEEKLSEVEERLSATGAECMALGVRLAAVEAERADLDERLRAAEAGGGLAEAEATAQANALHEARTALEEGRAEAVRLGEELAGGIEQAAMVCEAFETQLGALRDWAQVCISDPEGNSIYCCTCCLNIGDTCKPVIDDDELVSAYLTPTPFVEFDLLLPVLAWLAESY
jgi:chromosome segregation ATPase